MEEDRYESIHLIVKCRADGQSWFDIMEELISKDCDGIECSCGLESMGGSEGTLDQCYDYSTTVGSKLQPIDLARAIVALSSGPYDHDIAKPAIEWAKKEIAFEDYFELSEELEPYFSDEPLPDSIVERFNDEN